MKDYKLNFVDLPTGETIAYRHGGTGKTTILLIHGNMSSSVHFQPLMEKLERYFTVYAIDMVGFGDSSYRRKIFSLEDFSKDVTEFIRHFDLKDLYLVGWSTGGGVALETAVDNQERIKGVFLLSSVGVTGLKLMKMNLSSFGQLKVNRLALKKEIKTDFPTKQHALALKNKDKAFFKLLWDMIYLRNEPNEEDYEKFLEAAMKQRNYIDVVYSLSNFNMTTTSNGINPGSGRIYQLRCPIAILHGDQDGVVNIADARASAKIIGERAELIEFAGCGHSLLTDDLDRVYTEIVARIEA